LTLALAIVDDLSAAFMRAIQALWGHAAEPDTVLLAALEQSQSRITDLLQSPPLTGAVPPPSHAWNTLWAGLQATWKNSNLRRTAAETAARKALASAA
jgi:hypothetical protein